MDITNLSSRQADCLRLIHAGHSNKGIARALGISNGSVSTHVIQLYKKLGIHGDNEGQRVKVALIYERRQSNLEKAAS